MGEVVDDFLAFFGLARMSSLRKADSEILQLRERLSGAELRYCGLVQKIEARAYKASIPSKKPLTGSQLRQMNDAENSRFLDDRGEPSNSEILKEQVNG